MRDIGLVGLFLAKQGLVSTREHTTMGNPFPFTKRLRRYRPLRNIGTKSHAKDASPAASTAASSDRRPRTAVRDGPSWAWAHSRPGEGGGRGRDFDDLLPADRLLPELHASMFGPLRMAPSPG